jgi:hypothetical protein
MNRGFGQLTGLNGGRECVFCGRYRACIAGLVDAVRIIGLVEIQDDDIILDLRERVIQVTSAAIGLFSAGRIPEKEPRARFHF